MATELQKKAVKRIVENRGNNTIQPLGQVMSEVGYDDDTAKNPKNLTDSKGYKEELARYGLTEEFISCALVEDIKAKPKDRARELALGADILGMKQSTEKGGNKTLVLMVTGETAQRFNLNDQSNTPRQPEDSSS